MYHSYSSTYLHRQEIESQKAEIEKMSRQYEAINELLREKEQAEHIRLHQLGKKLDLDPEILRFLLDTTLVSDNEVILHGLKTTLSSTKLIHSEQVAELTVTIAERKRAELLERRRVAAAKRKHAKHEQKQFETFRERYNEISDQNNIIKKQNYVDILQAVQAVYDRYRTPSAIPGEFSDDSLFFQIIIDKYSPEIKVKQTGFFIAKYQITGNLPDISHGSPIQQFFFNRGIGNRELIELPTNMNGRRYSMYDELMHLMAMSYNKGTI